MSERIEKLQPNRSLHLRGFDALGASAALHSATANSFQVSGIFRDPADFCVLMLHDAHNFFEHPTVRYLPDSSFGGLTLTFDVRYEGLRTLDSPRYATIDWPYLDVVPDDPDPDPVTALPNIRVPLFPRAVQVGGTLTAAAGQFTIVDNGLQQGDVLRLWYLNVLFEYTVPRMTCAYAFTASGQGTAHTIIVAGTPYTYTELAGETEYSIAQHLADLVNASAWVAATRTFGQVDLRAKKQDGVGFAVSCSDSANTYTLYGVGAATVAASLAHDIAVTNWNALRVDMPITATSSGATISITAAHPGVDGNAIALYAVAASTRLTTTSPTATLSGGVSDATWRITLDFTALGIANVRQMWLTFAPPVSSGQPFTDTEWNATFTNWTVTGDPDRRKFQVAGPGSVRIDSGSNSCTYAGEWPIEAGFYHLGYARRSQAVGDTVTITYDCAYTHDLYLGTALYLDRGHIGARLDGGAETTHNSLLHSDAAVVTRLRLRSAVAAGRHTVTLRALDRFFYFDFLEAAVLSDVPAPPPARTNISPALDYSTDHTYKLSPARLLWSLDHTGMCGPLDQYLGVFWWNQRKRTGAILPSASVTFSGTFASGDQIFLEIGGLRIGKTVFPYETLATFAAHFAYFINATFVGVWAAANGDTLTITAHSPAPAYSFPLTALVEPSSSSGTLTVDGSLQGGVAGTWEVDPTQSPALNRGARAWHADFYAECAARGREVVTAMSMELVNPPAAFAARFADSSPVITSVGFGSLSSTHCAFNSAMRGYQQQVIANLCALQSDAGLVPHIQLGEFCWWYFTTAGSMGFYDAETKSLFENQAQRPLYVFTSPSDDPNVNNGVDATFLRDRLRDHVANLRQSQPAAQFEVLFPYDVNYPTPIGIHGLGGPLLRFLNFPPEWSSPATAGFDTLKMEALDFGSSTRSLTLARETMQFPIDLGWPLSKIRYLMPIFNGGCPWLQEYRLAVSARYPLINLWAFDHLCIFGLTLHVPARMARGARFK